MLKILVMIVLIYNLLTTVSNPTAQAVILDIGLLVIALSLVITTGKKVAGMILKVIAVIAILGYILLQFGVITI